MLSFRTRRFVHSDSELRAVAKRIALGEVIHHEEAITFTGDEIDYIYLVKRHLAF